MNDLWYDITEKVNISKTQSFLDLKVRKQPSSKKSISIADHIEVFMISFCCRPALGNAGHSRKVHFL